MALVPGNAREMVTAAINAAPPVKTLAPYYALFGDTEGLLWVQTSPPGQKETRLLVMDPSGKLVAHVTLRPGLTVYDIDRDYIVGSSVDTNGEPYVTVLRLNRRAAGPEAARGRLRAHDHQ